MNGISKTALVWSLFFTTIVLTACGTSKQSADANTTVILPGTNGSTTPVAGGGSVTPVAGSFFVALTNTNLTGAVTHLASASDTPVTFASGTTVDTSNLSSFCEVLDNSATYRTAANDISCVTEVNELDLYDNALNLQVNIPTDMCSYLRETGPDFFAYQPGVGNTTAQIKVCTDGSYPGGGQVNSANGVVTPCAYDYTPTAGPNCCVGSYTLTTLTEIPQASPVPACSGPFSSSITTVPWGGLAANCLTGPGKTVGLDENDNVQSNLYSIQGVGINHVYQIPASISSQFAGTGKIFLTNLWSANFYNLADNAGTVPAAFKSVLGVSPTGGTVTPFPYYEWTCLDQAEDVVARIRLMVRPWNQFPISEGGTSWIPVGTPEPGFPDQPLNDRHSWRDYGNNYPGTSALGL